MSDTILWADALVKAIGGLAANRQEHINELERAVDYILERIKTLEAEEERR